jgi:hypothetical protein
VVSGNQIAGIRFGGIQKGIRIPVMASQFRATMWLEKSNKKKHKKKQGVSQDG